MSEIQEWHTMPTKLEDWGPGEWVDKPDKRHWVDEVTGLDCLMVRNRHGVWCGYVGVTWSHPAFEKGYNDELLYSVNVHGGLTFAAACQETEDISVGICHSPKPGRSADVWWLGFDCGHWDDFNPRMEAYQAKLGEAVLADGVYRTIQYVEEECVGLAKQLKSLTSDYSSHATRRV